MSPEEKELLEKSVKLAEENNSILRSMRRSMIVGRVLSAIYWVLIIGSAIGAYYYIQPYLDQLIGIYGGAKSNLDSIGEVIKDFQR